MTEKIFLEEGKSGIAVFGTGYIARVFLQALEKQGLESAVHCFVESARSGKETFRGRPVLSVEEFKKSGRNELLCLAVHEAALKEVQLLLSEAGLSGRWIAPLIPELLYGEALEDHLFLPVEGILRVQDPDRCWLASRLCAIRGILEDDPEQRELYRKTIRLFSSEGTAGRRLRLAEQLVAAVSEHGFDPAKPILLDEDFRLIDGLHRLTLARYLGEELICCRIFPRSPLYDQVMDSRTVLEKKEVYSGAFTDEEIDLLEENQSFLLKGTEHMEQKGRDPLISVILPVYNVAGYIDTCLESLTSQTFPHFEALLIDDGSTDGSGERCDEWGRRDARIRVIHKQNGGVSSARNRGLEEARGEWLAFVDPDDWLASPYLEKLFVTAIENNADFVECDVWRVNGKTGRMAYRSCGGTMGKAWTREEHMKLGSTASYKAISKRSLWVRHQIRFPDCAFESPAVYALVLACAERIVNIPEALYYYRLFRPASLIETGYAGKDGTPNNTLGTEAMAHLLGEFRRLGLYDTYRDVLEGVVKYRLSDILATQFYRKAPEDYRETVGNFRAFLEKTFPDRGNERYVIFGGYNLNRILVHLRLLQDPFCRFNFSSLESVALEGAEAQPVHHKNRYREMMLQREEACSFWEVLREERPAYLFLDLLEERFDLLERNGRFLTAGDARREAAEAGGDWRVIPRESEECRELFRDRCRTFLRKVSDTIPGIRIVVVENTLCETVGNLSEQHPYREAEEIRRKNRVLKECYRTLRELCPEAIRIAPAEEPELQGLLFTDEKYEHGAEPAHLNELANRKIASLIEQRLFKELGKV